MISDRIWAFRLKLLVRQLDSLVITLADLRKTFLARMNV